jgi:hypothetical protein
VIFTGLSHWQKLEMSVKIGLGPPVQSSLLVDYCMKKAGFIMWLFIEDLESHDVYNDSVVQGGVMHSNATVVVFCLGDGVVSRFVSLSCSK